MTSKKLFGQNAQAMLHIENVLLVVQKEAREAHEAQLKTVGNRNLKQTYLDVEETLSEIQSLCMAQLRTVRLVS